jgi:hypothetical protein
VKGLRVAIVAALALATAVGVQVALGSSSTGGGAKHGPRPQGLDDLAEVNFISACRFSHRNQDDVIIFPGQPGASHDHTYVGNVSTNADSTVKSLLRSNTTCQRDGDTAAYWTPTLFDSAGNAVEPSGATIYYRRRTVDPVTAFPTGLRMIAGDARATTPQSRRVTTWSCGVESSVRASSVIPTCVGGPRVSLRLHVRFPSCWNGRDLDSADHKSHMAYPTGGACPTSHPVEVPAIALILRYPTAGGAGYELASGGQFSGHADFFNAWDERELQGLVERCLNGLRHCGRR